MEYTSEKPAIPPEKGLPFSESRGYNDNGCACFAEFVEIVVPKLIFHKNYERRIDQLHKVFCIFFAIEWQVTDKISTRIIFAHFVTRWRKKTDDQTVAWIFGL